MSRKVRRVHVSLDPGNVTALSMDEIRIILRGADELIMSGGRGLLAKVLKGSRQKSVLEHELDRSPVYGALGDLSLAQISERIDWLILNNYLGIEYDFRLPLLVYKAKGWEIERETYAAEMLDRLDQWLAAGDASKDLRWLTDKNPKVLMLVLEKIACSADPKYLPALKSWQNKATRRLSSKIREARRCVSVPGTT